jgi:Leucine-rich repeat (LRR) protein
MKSKLLILLFLASLSTYAQTNLVPNGGFENWTNSTTLSNWAIENSVSQNTTIYSEGSKSAQLAISNSTTKPKITALVPMIAGTTYTVKFKYKYVSANYSGQHPISLNISQNGSATTLSSSTFATNNNWTVKETTFTPDQNLSYDLSISLYTFDAAAFNVLIDDVQVYIQGTEQYTLIPDLNFEKNLIALGIDSGATDGKVLTNNVNKLTSLDVTGRSIADLTGIQDFVALTSLNCWSNQLTTLDVSKNVALTYLNCRYNKLTVLDVSKNVALTSLTCDNNKLTTLDVSKNVSLKSLFCEVNQLTTLDVSRNTALIDLNCSYNKITALDVLNNLYLSILDFGKNSFTNLNITKNTALTKLDCSSNKIKLLDLSKNINLTALDCTSNVLESLDVTLNTNLQILNCGNNGGANKFTFLDVSKNKNLRQLHIDGVNLSNLDLTNNILLEALGCSNNNLTTLDLSKNNQLNTLICGSNKLSTLDVSTNKLLNYLICYSNQLTTLNVSSNNALQVLNCSGNKLRSLNLKNGSNTSFLLTNKTIGFKDIYGNGWGVGYDTSFLKNVDLSCILVDDATYSNTNWATKKDSFAFYSALDCSIVTQIPDANFEDKLIVLGIDSDGKNGYVLNSSIAALTSLDVSNATISNLKGIEGFTALSTLNCSGNLFTKIDLSKNASITTLNCSNSPSLICIQVADVTVASNWAITKDATASFSLDCTIYTLLPDSKFEDKLIALQIDRDGKNGKVATESIVSLTSLYVSSSSITDLTGIQDFKALTNLNCDHNQLMTLDVSKNVALTSLYCDSNKLTTLDVSKNVALTSLDLEFNQLTALDLSKNTALLYLTCDKNQLTTLDLSKNTALLNLLCRFNQLTTLDLSKNINLGYVLASSNQLTLFDVSNNVKLYQFWCSDNKIKTLDFSKNPLLTQVLCHNNRLVSLNIKNGKNTIINTNDNGGVSFNGNPDLKCILVDDVAYANSNWGTKKDATASYNTDCTFYTLIPDSNFEQKLIDLGIDVDGKNGKVLTSSIFLITSFNVSGSSIADLTGIEDFVSLTELNCSNNVLTALNVAKNSNLTYLDCSANAIAALDVTKNTVLTDLYCNINKLTTIDVSKNLVLNKLNVSENSFTALDVSKNKALTEINCYKNSLTSLNLKNGNNVNMKRMNFSNLAQNPNLQCIQVDNASYCNSNWDAKDATAGYSSDCTPLANTYTTIPDAKFEDKLIALGIDKDGKNGKVLSASIFNVGTLDVSNSGITDLTGIQDFRMITSLTCGNNALTALDVSRNQSLDKLYCSVNKISNLDLTKNTAIRVVSCSFNLLSTLNVTANKSLKELECSNNNLTYLNIQNGNNANMQNMMFGNFTNNPKLTCILVDNEAYSIANWGLAKDKIASYNTVCVPYTILPDSNFEDLLIATGIDTDGKNGKVKTSSISSQVDLDVRSSAIADMTGIQDFTALKRLNCSDNLLTSLDISKNIALTNLFCEKNQLSNLNVSLNTKLDYLVCYTNQITTLDVSKNTALTYFSCGANLLTTVDVSKNTILTSLYCDKNKLVKLNIKNGNNNNITAFIATGNPTLTCIQVDDANYAVTAMAFFKDAIATYSATCSALGIEDSVFDKVAIFPNPTKGELHIDNIVLEKATVYDASGKLVKTTAFSSGAKDNTIHLDGFPSGIYYIYLESDGANTAKKIIVK